MNNNRIINFTQINIATYYFFFQKWTNARYDPTSIILLSCYKLKESRYGPDKDYLNISSYLWKLLVGIFEFFRYKVEIIPAWIGEQSGINC